MNTEKIRGTEIASNVAALSAQATGMADDIDAPVAELYAKSFSDENLKKIAPTLKSLVDSENPFPRIYDLACGIEGGNVGWSAERDGKRMPEWISEQLEFSDRLAYLKRLNRQLDECEFEDEAVEDVQAAFFGISRLIEQIQEEIQPLIGKYGA